MKTLILALVLFSGAAVANMQCGIQPIIPVGCTGAVCICDDDGCSWRFICN